MDRSTIFYKQVQLLVQLIPLVAEHSCFALKGGTAINLFVTKLPRLSVDIDLVYLPLKPRNDALQEIKQTLDKISQRIKSVLSGSSITKVYNNKKDALRLVIRRRGILVKIELSPVLRGTVFEPTLMTTCDEVEDEFGFAEIAVVSLPDLYAGKICAALDRQHPRDLFDVYGLLQNGPLSDELRKATIVYIASHNRPIAELLRPKYKDITSIYESEFKHMTEQYLSLATLENVRHQLIEFINLELTQDERNFLLSFKNKQPDWKLLGLDGVSELPALKWKQINLKKMSVEKHKEAYNKLDQILNHYMMK